VSGRRANGGSGPDAPPDAADTPKPPATKSPEVATAPAAGGSPLPGIALIRASYVGTAVLAATTALAVLIDGPPRGVAAVVAGVMFVLGCLAYLLGYAQAVRRSRQEVITMAGLAFLVDAAPAGVQRRLIGSTVAEVVVVVAAAAARPFTTLAFGILAPVFGLGLQCLWAARHGRFPARSPIVKGAPVRRP
jgi:hypothetical protein